MGHEWIAVFVSTIAALVSIAAALFAGRQAGAAKRQADAAHGEVDPTFHIEINHTEATPTGRKDIYFRTLGNQTSYALRI
jgi:hypothetical protein